MRARPGRCADEAGGAPAEVAASAAQRRQARVDWRVATDHLGEPREVCSRDLSPGGRLASRLRRRRARRWAQAAGMARCAASGVPGSPASPASPADGAATGAGGAQGPASTGREVLRPGEIDRAALAAVAAGVEGRSSREGGCSAAVLQGSMEYGFNVCHVESGLEAEFGDGAAILADAATLGATVVRQPGTTDLFFSQLFGQAGAGTIRMPLAVDFARALDGYRRTEFQPFLEEVYAAGLRVSLTLFGLGGGSTRGDLAPGDDPYGTGLLQGIHGFDWSAHAAETVDGHSGAVIASSAFLDVRDPYVRAYLGVLADGIAVMLADVEADFQRAEPGFRLGDVVYGVELMNELDVCNVASVSKFDSLVAALAGATWAQVAHRWAQPLWNTFLGELAVLLPGLSSHDVPADAVEDHQSKSIHTWAWKRAWISGFAWQFQREHQAFRGAAFSASEMCPSIDLHWYFRGVADGDTIGARHVARLVWQVDEIRQVLVDQGLPWTGVTVFESGSSVLAHPDGGSGGLQFVPTGWTREDFQAREVFRRLVGAAASGALAGGWHSYQSVRGNGPFAGMGVRADTAGVNAQDMLPRPSWYAYQRLTGVFGAWLGCAMVLPSSLGVNDDSRRQQDAVVVEFTLPSGSEGTWAYGYVCFLDPWRNTGSVDVQFASTRATAATSFGFPPFARTTVTPAPGGDIPSATAYYGAPAAFTVGTSPATVSLDRGDYPLLLLSNERLSWSLA